MRRFRRGRVIRRPDGALLVACPPFKVGCPGRPVLGTMRTVFGCSTVIAGIVDSNPNEEMRKMKKLIAVVIASMFAMSGAFAGSHAGAKDEKKGDAKMEKKADAKADAKMDKKADVKKDEKKAEKK